MSRAKTTMYFDGGCPLCRREVAHYRRLDRARRIRWIDIDRHREALEHEGIGYAQAMSRLHVRDRQGITRNGVEAFLALWDDLPGYRWLARGIRLLRLGTILDRGYGAFARSRYRRRCTGSTCTPLR